MARANPPPPAPSAFGGGRAGFVAFAVWLALAFCGLVVFLAGLAALQNYMYQKGDEAGRIQAGAGLARLSAGNSLRWDWWALFWAVAACTLPALALASGGAVVSQARLALVAWLSIATVVVFISTNRLYDIMGWVRGRRRRGRAPRADSRSLAPDPAHTPTDGGQAQVGRARGVRGHDHLRHRGPGRHLPPGPGARPRCLMMGSGEGVDGARGGGRRVQRGARAPAHTPPHPPTTMTADDALPSATASVSSLARAAAPGRPLLGGAAAGGIAAVASGRDGVTLYSVVDRVRGKRVVCGGGRGRGEWPPPRPRRRV